MNINEVKKIVFSSIIDDRGILTSIESGKDISFKIARVFYMHDISIGGMRGGHAHIDTKQIVIPISGEFDLLISDGHSNSTIHMEKASHGVYMPPMLWARLGNFSQDAVCLVLASTHYDITKSIRSWSSYLKILNLQEVPEPQLFSC